jgi:hypothetical protein
MQHHVAFFRCLWIMYTWYSYTEKTSTCLAKFSEIRGSLYSICNNYFVALLCEIKRRLQRNNKVMCNVEAFLNVQAFLIVTQFDLKLTGANNETWYWIRVIRMKTKFVESCACTLSVVIHVTLRVFVAARQARQPWNWNILPETWSSYSKASRSAAYLRHIPTNVMDNFRVCKIL